MSLRSRLTKLERSAVGEGGRCRYCPDAALVCLYRQEGPAGTPLPTGETRPGPCLACGRPADVIELVEVVVEAPSRQP